MVYVRRKTAKRISLKFRRVLQLDRFYGGEVVSVYL